MKKLTEGKKMFISVMAIFVVYAATFVIFDDYDRRAQAVLDEPGDWHLLWFSLFTMVILAVLLLRYSRSMDERISREQAEKQNLMRRQLTQNISHELKTPVASILGYMETLQDHPDLPKDKRQQFIDRSYTQAQRLTALLQDISILNRMDYANDIITRERVDVSSIIDDITEETELARQQRRMQLSSTVPKGIIVNGNPSLLYSIFRNLIDNSISYAGQGTTITMSALDMGDHWQFAYADNGQGVPREHLARLFERFYRVDKGRSRSMGGTGLGLAIVKNAIQLHGGTITVRINSGGGLGFDFTIKK